MRVSTPTILIAIATCLGATLPSGLHADTASQEARTLPSMSAEKKFTMKLESPQHKRYCQAKVTVGYLQRNTIANVEGKIEVEDCGAAGGEYTVTVRYRDEAGEIHNDEYVETWQRDYDQPVTFVGDYPIGENVDLMRVRARKIMCVCAETETPDDDPEETGGNDE